MECGRNKQITGNEEQNKNTDGLVDRNGRDAYTGTESEGVPPAIKIRHNRLDGAGSIFVERRGENGGRSCDQPKAGIPWNCLPGVVCVLFCTDEHVCAFIGRSAVDAEKFFSKPGGSTGGVYFAVAGERAVSYPQGKPAVFSVAVHFWHIGSVV